MKDQATFNEWKTELFNIAHEQNIDLIEVEEQLLEYHWHVGATPKTAVGSINKALIRCKTIRFE